MNGLLPSVLATNRRVAPQLVNRSWLRWMRLSPFRDRRLVKLQRAAEANPRDPMRTALYLRELRQNHPEEVVRKIERGEVAPSEEVANEYAKALVKTDQFNVSKVHEYIRSNGLLSVGGGYHAAEAGPYGNHEYASHLRASPQKFTAPPQASPWDVAPVASRGSEAFMAPSAQSNPSSFGMNVAATSTGTQQEPIYVGLAEPSFRAQMWKSVRVLGMTFLLLAGLGTFLEDRGIGRNFGINTDVQPEAAQDSPQKFEDVKGCDEAKAELEEIVQYLRSPSTFTRLGGKLPKGVLLVGPPGTGKTLLARAIAGEAGVPFFYASGSEFEEMFVGVGARRVRELFAAAKRRAPCIVFIDEIDAIGATRNPKDQQYMKMTLNQLLVELDGFNPSEGIIVIGATNFPESLDKALIRPGRFDRNVVVPNPDVEGRRQILELHTKEIPLSNDVDLSVIARGSPGFSGAELANLANMAALRAALEGAQKVAMEHFEYAKDKILMGAERRSAVISEQTRRLTAYHEGGHALVATYTPGALPVHKATIVPRGVALGMVSQLPEKDMTSMTKTQMLARMDVCMGGRASEQIIFGEDNITSGAESDFDQATSLAKAMVTRYGMSERLGQVVYDQNGDALSIETRTIIDAEVKRLVDQSYQRAVSVLKKHEKELHKVAAALLEQETLSGEEVQLAAKGMLKKPQREAVVNDVPVAAPPEKSALGDKGIPAPVNAKSGKTVGSGAPTV